MKKGIHRIKMKDEKRKEQGDGIAEKLARIFDIPGEVCTNRPKVTSIGRGEVLIENFKGIMDFEEGMIRINTNNGIIKVSGNGLIIREITNEEIIIGGKISNIDYDA